MTKKEKLVTNALFSLVVLYTLLYSKNVDAGPVVFMYRKSVYVIRYNEEDGVLYMSKHGNVISSISMDILDTKTDFAEVIRLLTQKM